MAEVKSITADDLLMNSWCCADEWMGTADQLVFSGIIERAVLPGEPGNNKVCATYYRRQPVGKGKNSPHDENYLSIKRYGKQKFIVRKGVSEEETLRRKTRKFLLAKHPELNIDSLPAPLFYIGERVGLYEESCCGKERIVDIRYENASYDGYVGYAYKIEPTPSEHYIWFGENWLYKFILSVVVLPNSATTVVQQSRRRGRLPNSIASFREAKYQRWRRDIKSKDLQKKLDELRKKSKEIQELIEVFSDNLVTHEAKIAQVKRELEELRR